MTSEFGGFPAELFSFFERLERDNTKTFWNAHKVEWEQHVRDPMRGLLAMLAEEFGPLRMFRPNRDVRFPKDKSPYKLWAGATSESRAVGGIGYYIEVSATRLLTGFGAMALAISSNDSGMRSPMTPVDRRSSKCMGRSLRCRSRSRPVSMRR